MEKISYLAGKVKRRGTSPEEQKQVSRTKLRTASLLRKIESLYHDATPQQFGLRFKG